ncbi:MAG: hypothetical protein RIB98_14960 [Acidimicrobiales bacterium]
MAADDGSDTSARRVEVIIVSSGRPVLRPPAPSPANRLSASSRRARATEILAPINAVPVAGYSGFGVDAICAALRCRVASCTSQSYPALERSAFLISLSITLTVASVCSE